MNKEKILNYLESGISLEAVVKELVRETGDQDFMDKVDDILRLQQHPNTKKDLDIKFDILKTKMDLLDVHSKHGLSDDKKMYLAQKYFETMKRIGLKFENV